MSKFRILVVDDERKVGILVARLLDRNGYGVIHADSGEEALSLALSEETLDLVLADINMPGLNGLDLDAALLRSRPGLPVIFMTGIDRDSTICKALRDSTEFLAKPFSENELVNAVRRVLDKGRQQG